MQLLQLRCWSTDLNWPARWRTGLVFPNESRKTIKSLSYLSDSNLTLALPLLHAGMGWDSLAGPMTCNDSETFPTSQSLELLLARTFQCFR